MSNHFFSFKICMIVHGNQPSFSTCGQLYQLQRSTFPVQLHCQVATCRPCAAFWPPLPPPSTPSLGVHRGWFWQHSLKKKKKSNTKLRFWGIYVGCFLGGLHFYRKASSTVQLLQQRVSNRASSLLQTLKSSMFNSFFTLPTVSLWRDSDCFVSPPDVTERSFTFPPSWLPPLTLWWRASNDSDVRSGTHGRVSRQRHCQ